MCGIFGYVGKQKSAPEIVLAGLKQLEYRGYDSWGIASKTHQSASQNTFVIEKHVGRIGNAYLDKKLQVSSHLAIGHTRWATHGGVTKKNAHPHLDCTKTIAVVHNGIIENFAEIKAELQVSGHKFLSETDSEIISHLIEENLSREGFASAVRDTFNQLKGMNAIVVAYAPSAEIIAAKNGSPLVVGIGENEILIASDAAGISKYAKNVIFLEDNQLAILGRGVKLISLPNGETIKPVIQTLDWKFETTEKGKYAHFVLKEIHEEPKILLDMAHSQTEQAKTLAVYIEKAFGTFMVGCGSAGYSAIAGVYLFSNIAKKHINFSIGSEFNYLEDYLTPKSLVIAISQSGETIDVVEPVTSAKKKGCKVAAIVNVIGSTLYRQSDYNVLLGAGVETAVVGTKSLIAMVAIQLLTAYSLIKKQDEGKKLLVAAAKDISVILSNKYIENVKNIAKSIKKQEHIYVIGRGLAYATTMEASLKLKETACVHAEGFAGGELKHGSLALIEKGTPCIVFAPNDETFDAIISNAQELKARGGFIIGVGPKENRVFDRYLKTDDIKEATALSQIAVSHVLAYYLALARDIRDPDKPRNLAKSVTVK